VFSLSKEYDMLSQPRSSMEFHFSFNMDAHAFVCVAMLKHDRNLDETRDKMVPDEVEEEDFWRNYFYKIECCKAELGLPTRLGDQIGED